MVQDLYVKAIGSHKPATVKASDAEGHVQKFKVPATPRSPEESNIADEIKSYEAQVVDVEGDSAEGEAVVEEKDWFEEDFFEEEEQQPAKGH